MSELIGQLISWAEGVMLQLGYVGITFVIALEVIIPPIPSEVFLPLAGSMSADGEFNFLAVVVAATLGTAVGASALYGVSRWAGETRLEQWIDKYGKWLLVTNEDLEKSRRWFARYGTQAVLICRVIPGMRSVICVPAGLTGMPYGRFVIFTVLGSLVWNFALVGAGYLLGKNWQQVEEWIDPISPVIYALIILSVLFFVAKRLFDKRKSRVSSLAGDR